MKKFICYLAMCLIFLVSCNNQPKPRQLKLIKTPEIYSPIGIDEDFYIVKTINDSMGFAVDDISCSFDDTEEPECVIITDELCYDDKSFHTYIDEGLWITVGTWKENNKTYPVIKYHEFDSIELVAQKLLLDTIFSPNEYDSIVNEYKDKAYFLKLFLNETK